MLLWLYVGYKSYEGGWMMSEKQYQCRVCGKQTTIKEGQSVPFCCGKEMEPLPYCRVMPDPEQARNYDEDEPCDDGVSRKQK